MFPDQKWETIEEVYSNTIFFSFLNLFLFTSSIFFQFSHDENEKPLVPTKEKEEPSQALTKIKAEIESSLKASSTIIPPNQNQSDEDEEIVDFSAQLESQEI